MVPEEAGRGGRAAQVGPAVREESGFSSKGSGWHLALCNQQDGGREHIICFMGFFQNHFGCWERKRDFVIRGNSARKQGDHSRDDQSQKWQEMLLETDMLVTIRRGYYSSTRCRSRASSLFSPALQRVAIGASSTSPPTL